MWLSASVPCPRSMIVAAGVRKEKVGGLVRVSEPLLWKETSSQGTSSKKGPTLDSRLLKVSCIV